jgi:hypothetical protein
MMRLRLGDPGRPEPVDMGGRLLGPSDVFGADTWYPNHRLPSDREKRPPAGLSDRPKPKKLGRTPDREALRSTRSSKVVGWCLMYLGLEITDVANGLRELSMQKRVVSEEMLRLR